MDIQEDVNRKLEQGSEKILSYNMQALELTEEIFKELLNKVKNIDTKNFDFKDKYSTTSVGKMTNSGRNITVISEGMMPDVAKKFYKFASKQNIPFSMLQDRSTSPPTYQLCIYKSQEGVFKNVLQNFLHDEAERKTKPSLRNRLKVKVREAKERNSVRQAERGTQERSR